MTICNYKEFFSYEKETLKKHVHEKDIENKKIILNYLKNGEEVGIRCSSTYDYIENFSTGETIHLFSDGKYVWTSEEIYHFEKYNMDLSNEFINYVINKMC